MKSAIIDSVTPLKLAGETTVKVDNATGFAPLLQNKDHDLHKLNIKIINTDNFNKNENAVIDRACQEIEQELKRAEPDGRPVTNTTLQRTVMILNQKLRRGAEISALEIYFNRDMHTGQNLNLDDEKIRAQQKQDREKQNEKHNHKIPHTYQTKPNKGDIIVLPQENDKHKARPSYLVTSTEDDKMKIQRIIHPHSSEPTKLMSKVYQTSKERAHVIFKPTPAIPNQQNEKK